MKTLLALISMTLLTSCYSAGYLPADYRPTTYTAPQDQGIPGWYEKQIEAINAPGIQIDRTPMTTTIDTGSAILTCVGGHCY